MTNPTERPPVTFGEVVGLIVLLAWGTLVALTPVWFILAVVWMVTR